MTGLDKIIEKITADAKEEAKRHSEGADMTIAHMKAEAIDNMMRLEKVYQDRGERLSRDIVERAKSSSEMEYRNGLLKKKAEMINLAFEKAKEKILSMKKEEYVSFMSAALVYAVNERKQAKERIKELFGEEEAELDTGYEIIFNKKDVRNKNASLIFANASKELNVSGLLLSKVTAEIDGGFIVKCGEIETNCSVSNMVGEVRSECESKVIQKLF